MQNADPIWSGSIGKTQWNVCIYFHDRNENQWIAARDPFGIKPLYFYEDGGYLYFASEIKCFLGVKNFKARRNEKALHQYLAFQMCLDNETLFEGVRKIMPGHYLQGNGSSIQQNLCFWDTNYIVDNNHTEEYFLEKKSDSLLRIVFDCNSI